MANPGPYTRQALIDAEIDSPVDGSRHGRLPAGHQGWCRSSGASERIASDPPGPPASCVSAPDTELSAAAAAPLPAVPPAQLLRLPLAQVRFLQPMAEHGAGARQCRLGLNPPEGHVEFRSLSD